jgi:hypothetical protein
VVRAPSRPRRLVAGIVAAGSLTLAFAAPVGPAGAEPGHATDLGVLSERYNLARLRLDRATAALQATRQRVEATRDEAERVKAIVRARAARLYRGTAGGGVAGLLGAASVNELARRAEYVGAAARPDRALLRELSETLDRLETEEQSSRDALSRLRAEAEALSAARKKLLAEAAAARRAAELRARAQGAGPVGTPRVMQPAARARGRVPRPRRRRPRRRPSGSRPRRRRRGSRPTHRRPRRRVPRSPSTSPARSSASPMYSRPPDRTPSTARGSPWRPGAPPA